MAHISDSDLLTFTGSTFHRSPEALEIDPTTRFSPCTAIKPLLSEERAIGPIRPLRLALCECLGVSYYFSRLPIVGVFPSHERASPGRTGI